MTRAMHATLITVAAWALVASADELLLQPGHCGVTVASRQSCTHDSQSSGAWNAASLRVCLRRCTSCPRCSVASYSSRDSDCSWYAQCDVSARGLAQGTGHETVVVRHANGTVLRAVERLVRKGHTNTSSLRKSVARCHELAASKVWPPEVMDVHSQFAEAGISSREWRREDVEQCLNLLLVPQGARVLEIGANIGRSTIMLAQRAARVWSHEALPEPFARLQTSTARLVEARTVSLHRAISEVPLYVSGAWDVSPYGKGERVPIIPVSEVMQRPYDVVVADCEGCFHSLVEKTKGQLLHYGRVQKRPCCPGLVLPLNATRTLLTCAL